MTARDSVCLDLYSGDVHEKLSKKTCLKCCEGGNVLACNNGDCPIVLHESCMPCGAWFGSDGEFLCPYCFYKQSRVECHQAKKKALLARKALSSFLDLNMSMENGYMQNSRSLRGKELDSSANNISSDSKAEIGEASHQPMQVDGGQLDDCSKVQMLGAEQQEAGSPTRSHYWAKGTVSKESENLNKNSQETVKMLQPSDNVSLGKEQIQAELQGTSVYVTENANGQDMNEEPIKGSDDAFGDDFSVRSQKAFTSRNAEHPAEIGNHCGRTEEGKSQEKSPKNAPCHMMEDFLSVTLDKLGNLKDLEHAAVEEFNDGGAEKGPNQLLHEEISVCLAKENDKLEMHKESNQGNNSKFQDNCSVRSKVAVNSDAEKPAEVRDDHFKRTNEVPEKDVHPMRDSVSVTHGESEAGDHSASSQHSCNTGTLKNANKDEESFETSQGRISELEEHEEVTNGTWRKIVHPVKRSQRPTLPNMRRRKLLWTVEEVEMLKEGVQKFSLTVNKNMPWMKILDYGRHVFDGTRTPTDLKEKWKQLKRSI